MKQKDETLELVDNGCYGTQHYTIMRVVETGLFTAILNLHNQQMFLYDYTTKEDAKRAAVDSLKAYNHGIWYAKDLVNRGVAGILGKL